MLMLAEFRGKSHVVLQLKCDHVALQRAAGGNPLRYMRDLEPSVPLWRLRGGYPRIIKDLSPASYSLVRKGCPTEIRFWLTMFAVYRVLECDFKPKLGTIIAPFTGNNERMELLLEYARIGISPFMNLSGEYPKERVGGVIPTRIVPKRVLKILSAGPTSNPSVLGIFFDAFSIVNSTMLDHFRTYLGTIRTELKESLFTENTRWSEQEFLRKLYEASSIVRDSNSEYNWKSKTVEGTLGKLAFKEEAAGKLRVFAIVDS